MKDTTTALMQGLAIRRIECDRRLWSTRKGIAEHYRAQRANGLLSSINSAAGMKSNPEHARQLRNLLKGEPTV